MKRPPQSPPSSTSSGIRCLSVRSQTAVFTNSGFFCHQLRVGSRDEPSARQRVHRVPVLLRVLVCPSSFLEVSWAGEVIPPFSAIVFRVVSARLSRDAAPQRPLLLLRGVDLLWESIRGKYSACVL